MYMAEPRRPTVEECNNRTVIESDEDGVYIACWYPSMGGYSAPAVVGFPCEVKDPCVDVYVWHDGEFPFGEDGDSPTVLHHCSVDQFIDFGTFVKEAINARL